MHRLRRRSGATAIVCVALAVTWIGPVGPPSASASPVDPVIDEALTLYDAVLDETVYNPHVAALWRDVVIPAQRPVDEIWMATVPPAVDRWWELYWSVRRQVPVYVCFPFAMTVACI